MNSARSADSSKSALYISCVYRLPRRMSVMNTIFGFIAAMYVKFCSGPTKIHAAGLSCGSADLSGRTETRSRSRAGCPTELTARLRQFFAELPELLIAQPRRQRVGRGPHPRGGREHTHAHDKGENGDERARRLIMIF